MFIKPFTFLCSVAGNIIDRRMSVGGRKDAQQLKSVDFIRMMEGRVTIRDSGQTNVTHRLETTLYTMNRQVQIMFPQNVSS